MTKESTIWLKAIARIAIDELGGVEPELGRMVRRGQRLIRDNKRAVSAKRKRRAQRAPVEATLK